MRTVLAEQILMRPLGDRELIALMAASLYPDKDNHLLNEELENLAVNRAMRILAEVDSRIVQPAVAVLERA